MTATHRSKAAAGRIFEDFRIGETPHGATLRTLREGDGYEPYGALDLDCRAIPPR
ncbi:MAG: hypothetical protein ABR878_18165 [Roseiarcus sp.]|jgi:hypothetical protein